MQVAIQVVDDALRRGIKGVPWQTDGLGPCMLMLLTLLTIGNRLGR